MAVETYKVLLVGEGGVGKTTFRKRYFTGEFITEYNATLGVEVDPLSFNTNHGFMTLKMCDCAGQEKFSGLKAGYYIEGDGVIVMFDVTSYPTFDRVPYWLEGVRKTISHVPLILCGNKIDVSDREVPMDDISSFIWAPEQEGKITNYYDISSKSNYQTDKLLLTLLRQMSGYDDLIFIEMPPLAQPPEIGDFSQEEEDEEQLD